MRQIVGSVQLGSIEGRFGLLLSLEWSRASRGREGLKAGGSGRWGGTGSKDGREGGNLHVKTNSKINFFRKSRICHLTVVLKAAVLLRDGS